MSFQAFRKRALNPSLIKGGVWLTVERIVLGMKGLVLSYLFANFVEKDTFGSYQYILSIISVLTVFSLPGLNTAIVRAVANNRLGTFSVALKIVAQWSLIGSAILLFLAGKDYFFTSNQSLSLPLVSMSLLFSGYSLMNYWRYYYLGKENYSLFTKTSLWIEGISFTTTTFVIFYIPTLMGLIFGSVIITLLVSMTLIFRINRETRLGQSLPEDIAYGKKLSFSYAIITATSYTDKLLIAQFLGFSHVAVYTVASMIPEQIRSGLSIFNTLLLPNFSKTRDHKEYRQIILKGIFFLTILFLFVIAFYAAIAPAIFSLLFPTYLEAIPYSQVIAFGTLFTPLLILDSFFRGQQAEKIVLTTTTFTSVGGLLLTFLLIPAFGLWGAVMAKIGTVALNGLCLLFVFLYQKRSLINN